MKFFQHSRERNRGELRIIGAISIDLDGLSDEDVPPKFDEEEQTKVIQTILKEFCSNSTVHGVRYLAERKRHWIERLWWAIACSLSVFLCIVAIWSIWAKWHRRPVIVSFDDKTTSIGMIPFPAVTICSTEKFTRDQLNIIELMKFTDLQINQTSFASVSSEAINQVDAMMHICSKEFIDMAEDLVVRRTESIYETIRKISPKQSSIIVFSTWLGQLEHLQPIFTGEGLCYTFNSINSRDIYSDEIAPDLLTVSNRLNATNWDMEKSYTSNVDEHEIYPYRVFGCGVRDSLAVILGIYLDELLKLCTESADGFRISLHSPDHLPRLPDEFIHIPVEQDIYISVKPNMITTSPGLRRYTPSLRGCYFRKGRKLRFFRLYSQQHCELECLANFTKENCGCVKFAMPRDKQTRVCTIADIRCYINAEQNFKKNQHVSECRCVPDCTMISYDVEISQAQARYSADDIALKSSINDTDTSLEAMSKLFISFKENHFLALNRSEAYTMMDFIASCGGLLGLFMGISVLSVIELIYFFTLRLCCKLSRNRKISQVKASKRANRTNIAMANNKPFQLYY